MHTWTKQNDARCATQRIGLSLRIHIIANSGSMTDSLHCDYNEKRTNASRQRAYWTMVVILQNTLVANSTMMGPLKSQSHEPYSADRHRIEQRHTSGLSLTHFEHFVYDAGVTFTPLDVHRTPPVNVFCLHFRLPFFAQNIFDPCSRGGSSRNPGLTVTT
jgi:hypothetical protein